MKSLIFSLAFLLVSSMNFANNTQKNQMLEKGYKVVVTTSCGEVGSVWASDIEGLIEGALELDEWLCG